MYSTCCSADINAANGILQCSHCKKEVFETTIFKQCRWCKNLVEDSDCDDWQTYYWFTCKKLKSENSDLFPFEKTKCSKFIHNGIKNKHQ